jgi:hypothetical protein
VSSVSRAPRSVSQPRIRTRGAGRIIFGAVTRGGGVTTTGGEATGAGVFTGGGTGVVAGGVGGGVATTALDAVQA